MSCGVCRSQTRLESDVAVTVVEALGYSSDLTPSLGTSICRGFGPRKRKEKQIKMQKSFVLSFFFFFFFFFFSLGLYLWHVEVPRLGVESELQLPATATTTMMWDLSQVCHLHHSSGQCQILNLLSKARDRTHILMDISRGCYH